MSLELKTPEKLYYSVIRNTAGKKIAKAAARAKNQLMIAEIIQLRPPNRPGLDRSDFIEAAKRIGRPAAEIHAFADIESGSYGPFKDGRLTILPEPHKFSKLTKRAFDKSHPHLSYPKSMHPREGTPEHWNKHPYRFSMTERWMLWAQWAELDIMAACGAISTGKWQVMAYHAKSLGYPNPYEFIKLMYRSEHEQLDAFLRYLVRNGIVRQLKRGNLHRAIALYNGRGQVPFYLAKYKKRLAIRQLEYA